MKTDLIQPISTNHQNYLTDESKQEGNADSISFPTSEKDVQEIMKLISGRTVTFQGANTGTEGLAVPHGGHIINFSKMNKILEIGIQSDEEGYAIVEPGVLLLDLTREVSSALRKEAFFWPPNPTETSASIGGIAASGAYGMDSYHYGNTSQYISALNYVSPDGDIRTLNRDTKENADKLDQFLASESKAGPITQLTLRLVRKPESIWGLAFFFDNLEESLSCADELQGYHASADGAWIESMEYLDQTAISLVEQGKESIAKIRSIPSVPENTAAMILIEIAGNDDAIEEILMEIMEITANYGSDPDTAWALATESEVEKLHDFRHAATEMIIQRIEKCHREDARITKLGANPVYGGVSFSKAMLPLYKTLEEEKLTAAIYSHIKNSDIQINILPENYEEFERGKMLTDHWTQTQ